MTCPYMNGVTHNYRNAVNGTNNGVDDENGDTSLDYTTYLQLRPLLNCTSPISKVHDEHLFILVHQVYELWFKQILYEVDSIREIFSPHQQFDDRDLSKVFARLTRVNKIYEILIQMMNVVETITPLDFAEFRGELGSSSGFQSYQFRLLENKIGIRCKKRVRYNDQDYIDSMPKDVKKLVTSSEEEPALNDLIGAWLEETPGMKHVDFWDEFTGACAQWFRDDMACAEKETDMEKKQTLIDSCMKHKKTFGEILKEDEYKVLYERGDRVLSWKAFKAAIMIYYNRHEVQYHLRFQIITALMDLDSLITKWRSAHVLMVQRQIGNKAGTGGSSGYHYLRSTLGDRYRPFLDLFQLSNYLIPVKYWDRMAAPKCTDIYYGKQVI